MSFYIVSVPFVYPARVACTVLSLFEGSDTRGAEGFGRRDDTCGPLTNPGRFTPRTILRDVEALPAAGVPVYAERGLGGAIVLYRQARLDIARLDPAERQLLTVAWLDPNLFEQVGLQAVQTTAQKKLTAVATRGQSSTPSPLSEGLLIDPSRRFATEQEVDLIVLLTAARERRRILLRYRRSGMASGQWLAGDPYGLVN